MKRFISLLLSLLAQCATAQLRPSQIEALTGQLSNEFSMVRWTSSFSADLGFIYLPSAEAKQLEIESLEQQAKTNPEDAESRARLALLLRYASPVDAQPWQKEAETLYRTRLAADPADTHTLALLAGLLKGTDEAETLAHQAIEKAPDAWQSWHAMAQHQLQKLRLQVYSGLKSLPESGMDQSRIEEALRLQSRDTERTQALLELGESVLANGRKAAALAPPGESVPFQNQFASAMEVHLYTRSLYEFRGLPLPDANDFYRQGLDILAKTAIASRDQPETLGVLAKLQFNNLLYSLPTTANGKPDPDLLEKRQSEVLGPTLTRLRELCDHPDPGIAAAACEAYAVTVYFIPIFGGHPPSDNSELPALLAKAVRLAPRRPWAWDLRIFMAIKPIDGLPPPNPDTGRELALERLQHLPTGRSHAFVAVCSKGPPALQAWDQALKQEPENVEYLLNAASTLMIQQQTPATLAAALVRLQKATSVWYANPVLQAEFPRLDPYRLRLFAAHQALSGNLESARQTLTTLLDQYAADPDVLALQETLRPTP